MVIRNLFHLFLFALLYNLTDPTALNVRRYKDLLESDMKRLKLNSIRIPIDNIVSGLTLA